MTRAFINKRNQFVFRASEEVSVHCVMASEQRHTHCKKRGVFAMRVKAFLFTRGDLVRPSVRQPEVADPGKNDNNHTQLRVSKERD